ncbi:unnamed protein product [Paramecium pentaurelia]|uniref:WD40-repeat-containing domain n=1 Tax=Paramecium pentaurelia TaxID=43138 RepID=A0A8S1YFJ7_9CILI|nr:unnamed protein product [Paramecium pentaurelia]
MEKDKMNLGIKEKDGIIANQDNNKIFENIQQNLLQEMSEVIKTINNWIEKFQSELEILRKELMIKLDQAIFLLRDWSEALQLVIQQKPNLSQYKIEIQQGLYSQPSQILKKTYEDSIKQVNSSYLQKIILAKDSLKKEIEQDKIEILFKNFCIWESQLQKKELYYKLINQIVQKEICYSLAFNQQGTIMVSCSQDAIKIWRFQDGKQIDCIQQIYGDSETDYATSLVFSRRTNFFIAGSFDSSIKLYYDNNDKWYKQASNKSHGGLVTCVILNKQEDQLISCSSDFLIFIWKINLTLKSIEFDYELQRHEKAVIGLSINLSETEFVSTGYDQKIIIWKKKANQKWIFNQLIDHQYSDIGCGVSYITDTMIAWQQSDQPYIHFFELKKDIYVEKNQLILEYSKCKTKTQLFLFPTLYNNEKKVIIQKFNSKIYFILLDKETNQFKVDSNSIECSSSVFFGNLSQDGKFLVIWDYLLTKYQIYELCYE